MKCVFIFFTQQGLMQSDMYEIKAGTLHSKVHLIICPKSIHPLIRGLIRNLFRLLTKNIMFKNKNITTNVRPLENFLGNFDMSYQFLIQTIK